MSNTPKSSKAEFIAEWAKRGVKLCPSRHIVVTADGSDHDHDYVHKESLIGTFVCPTCSDTHLMIYTPHLCISLALRPEQAEAIARQLISPPPLQVVD